MKRIISFGLAIALTVFLSSCKSDTQIRSEVTGVLSRDGYTEIQVTGSRFFGCSDSDLYRIGFTAKKNGRSVEGIACAGATKAWTIRYEN